MTVHDLRDDQGRTLAFEVDSTGLGRRGLCQIAAKLPGVNVIRTPKFLSWLRETEFCEFEIDGIRFVAEEPYGDNSRYWIGTKPPRYVIEIERIRKAFLEGG